MRRLLTLLLIAANSCSEPAAVADSHVAPAMVLGGQSVTAGPVSSSASPRSAESQPSPGREMLANGFRCPKDGTIVDYRSQSAIWTTVFRGSSPDDPTMCRTAARNGGFWLNVYSFYSPASWLKGEAAMRDSMDALLSGKQAGVSFQYDVVGGSVTPGARTWQIKWTRVGYETANIAGRNIGVIIFENDNLQLSGEALRWIRKYWYDPATGLWLKQKTTLIHGYTAGLGSDWEVTRISN